MSQYLSQEGLEKLQKELEERKTTIRSEINKRLTAAKELGDISENAEFDEAMAAQSFNEGRIAEMEDILKQGEIIGPHTTHDIIDIGSTVTLKSERGQQKFTIVGTTESNPLQGFISNESPVGSVLLGHKKGDEVTIKSPSGAMTYKIIDVM